MKIINENILLIINRNQIFLAFILIFILSCEDFVEVDPPRTDLTSSTVFLQDETANAAMLDIYYQLVSPGFASGSTRSITFLSSLSSDELINYNSDPDVDQFYSNNLSPTNFINSNLWSSMYSVIYKSNSILEGLNNSTTLSEDLKKQLLGEAKFMRAFCHFYLLNLFGDIPLITTTDYITNTNISRSESDEVYNQIINDLISAQQYLLDDYSFSDNNRNRVNKGAATALLSRVYLFHGDWANAEIQATSLINNSNYSLVSDLSQVFFVNSSESILQLTSRTNYPEDIFTFYIFSTTPSNGALRPELVESFELGDMRRSIWIKNTSGTPVYFFPSKYQSFAQLSEFTTIFRLAEQYLIRAEARAMQNNIVGNESAISDLNIIRNRAGLNNSNANDLSSALSAIQTERLHELFTEWGHRWIDLKRYGIVDDVMSNVKNNWESTDQLYPIPEEQLISDPFIEQNPGY